MGFDGKQWKNLGKIRNIWCNAVLESRIVWESAWLFHKQLINS